MASKEVPVIPVPGVADQTGVRPFGSDPPPPCLMANFQVHELDDNLHIVDASFTPSIGAMKPALTAVANAIRIGDRFSERLV